MARGLLNVALAAVAIALALAAPGEGAAKLRLTSAGGSLSLSNSKAGQAVLSAAAMRPGQEVSGSVTIGNTGTVPAALNLAAAGIQDVPGLGGGRLSDRLQLRVLDVTSAPVTMYSGALRAMGAVGLGSLAPGASRTFVFVAAITPGAADNAFQGAAIQMGFEWSAVGSQVVVTPTPTPTATPPPAPPAVPDTSTPAVGPELTGEARGARIFRLPAATRCLSRRSFTIRVRLPAGTRFKTLTIRVNGKVKLKRKGLKARKVKARINLRGMPKGKVVVKIAARTNTGRTAVRKRTYHTCAKRR